MENRNFYLKARKVNNYDIDVHNWLKILFYEVKRNGKYKLTVKIRGEEKIICLKTSAAFNIDFAEGWPPKHTISWPVLRTIMEDENYGRA